MGQISLQINRRTIALNLRDVECFKTMLKFEGAAKTLPLRDAVCDNLLPVLTHELGHVFGLEHISETTGIALMNARLSESGSVPTRIDVSALVAVLERSVVGASPGELEFRASDGLIAPKDWTPKRRRVEVNAANLSVPSNVPVLTAHKAGRWNEILQQSQKDRIKNSNEGPTDCCRFDRLEPQSIEAWR